MAGKSLTKEFHRLMRRIGRLTDGQASIEDVDWDEGGLSSFRVTIRPNAGYYKGGRFKFTVRIPDNYKDGKPPNVWCDTEIYHPNIDRYELLGEEFSNVCLSIFEDGTWSQSHGLEGVIIGIIFLMHHPNIRDPLAQEFSGDMTDEEFRQNVLDYMAGKTVAGEFEFSKDFRVIDGEFKDITLIENIIDVSINENEIVGANCDTNDFGNGVVEAVGGPVDGTDANVDNGRISGQDLHRLARRIGRITDGQASIENGEWEKGELCSFIVIIRPNASYYKSGRFYFTVHLPEGYEPGEPIDVRCDTTIYHPNIDTSQGIGHVFTNVCFDNSDTTTESQCYRLESVVHRIIFLMHHPNLNDPLSPEFDSGSITDEEFRKNVLDYMAGKTVAGEYTYSIGFRVINGVYRDLSIHKDSDDEDEIAAANCDVDAVDSMIIKSDTNKNTVENKSDIVGNVLNDDNVEGLDVHISLNDASKTTADDVHTLENSTELDPDHSRDRLDDYDEDDDAEIMPVKFVIEEVDECGSCYFVIDYTGLENRNQTDGVKQTFDDTSNNNDISENNATSNQDYGRTIETDKDAPTITGRERSKSTSHMYDTYRSPLIARSISVPNGGQAKAMNMHKQPNITLVGTGLRGLLLFALDCVLTVSKSML